MMEITPANARLWSRLGSRGMFGQAILALAGSDPKLMVLSADLGNSSGLERFRNSYPEQFLNVGIAEQNMIGIAGGLAKEGFTVFATSFAPFISMRAAEQIRMNLGYMELNVKAVAIGSGLAMGLLGNSHYGLEDAAIMRAIPNLTVVCPADCGEIAKTVFAAASHHGPMYIRLTGSVNTPVVYQADYPFEIGKAITLREGKDIALIATGSMVHAALETAIRLEAKGISCSVVNMHTLKPLDTGVLEHLCTTTKLMVTLEEHSRIGGLGSAVAEHLAGFGQHPPLEIIGLADKFDKAGEYPYLLDMHGLTPERLTETVFTRYQRIA
ncbi:MAG: transketolase family protein [Dechloromonas sp.]|uniref:transketolase family protein n=1 Tax=Azonexus hydrophilus TaxID=418702 RepID=UPI00042675B6|nr:transketolase C-terminal domain-containing protein [Azonexus hydrophilus]MCA1939059.1 transketolase family protein [Dechloromonas sp.]